MIDGIPAPEPECPKCGAKQWSYIEVPGQTDLQRRLIKFSDRLMVASFGVFVAAIFLFVVPDLREIGFVAIGLLLILVPAVFIARQWAYGVRTMVDLCQACGFVKSE